MKQTSAEFSSQKQSSKDTLKICKIQFSILKIGDFPWIMFIFRKVLDQLIRAALLKINPITNSSKDLPGL